MKAVLSSYLLATALALGQGIVATNVHDFDWSIIEPSTSLNYTPCYNAHRCAKLLVPLDWLDHQNPRRVTLAIIARPAVVDERDPSFGGSIIVNPGGPSGAGIPFVLRWGETLQSTADGKKKYEILSFDPRGVGFTTPPADCYHDEFARVAFGLQGRGIGGPEGGPDVLRRLFSRVDGHGELCDDSDSIRSFMSTSSVARDMVEIVDRLHELRTGYTGEHVDERKQLELRSWTDHTPRIQYWGFSYGTVLGRYFASMFPGRVGRMMLEAVEDVHEYANSTWSGNLKDVQDALQAFWDTCYKAGPRCALYDHADRGPDDINSRVRSFMSGLERSPASYVSHNTVATITKQDIVDSLFSALYSPSLRFPEVAEAIAAALKGNFTQLYLGLDVPGATFTCPSTPKDEEYTWFLDAQAAIACGDGEPQTSLTILEFQKHLERLRSDSPDFATRWSRYRLECKGWRVRPKYRFTGPWVTPEADPSLVEGKPAAPLLFVSSRTDPVTPLQWAMDAREGHPGSGLLIQESVGHGAILEPGRCREDYVKKYWDTGDVPPEGVTCEPDCEPFQDCPSAKAVLMSQKQNRQWYPLGLI
ncbi:Tripeptidyl aminopeptidase [Paramyrothecium foliicola]|nr:Tripeptidyl aminopeptidase [Paramyrothecium foliicola]